MASNNWTLPQFACGWHLLLDGASILCDKSTEMETEIEMETAK